MDSASFLEAIQDSSNAASQVAQDSNSILFLFDIEPLPGDPYSQQKLTESNPHLLGQEEVKPVMLEIPAIVGEETMATYRERPEGAQIEYKRKVVVALDADRINVGGWAYLIYRGQLIGGQVISVRDGTPPLTQLEINTSRQVPFTPSIVDLQNWEKRLQG